MVGRCRGMVLGSRGVIFGDRGILGLSFIGDFGNKAFISIRVVLDMLDTSIRKVDRVRSFHVAGSVTCLASAEHRLGVVVGHRVVVRVRRDLVRIGRLGVVGGLCWGMVGRCRGMVGRGSFDYRSVVCRSSLHHRGMVSGRNFDHRDMVGGGWSMISRSRSMVGRSSFDYRSVVCRSRFVVHWGGMDNRDYTGVHCPVGLVHGVADGRRVALLDHLQLMGFVKWHSKDSARESAKTPGGCSGRGRPTRRQSSS